MNAIIRSDVERCMPEAAQMADARNREHRIRTSLQRHVGESCDSAIVERLAEQTYHENRGIYFTKAQLAAMPWQSRELIESEGRRLFGPRRRA